ncbi:MAG: filamentous hemagglutinin N-terminal domain-containing protein [Coleofasciculaceae cyanobacterium]
MISTRNLSRLFTLLLPVIPLGLIIFHDQTQAQTPPITAELGTHSTGTTVTSNGNQFDISGGTRAGENLFHSFEKFGLNQNQIANFLANPNIQNILGRVVGGDPSFINGLIKVTSQGGIGNHNLVLMNPSGIIFGSNSSLNVPASFTATTATGIGFGNSWFNASGNNNYALLTGNLNGFAFTTTQPGAIINAGNLKVAQGNLTLLGGTVTSTGQLSASGRQIIVAAVPGENLVRITQPGQLLSLEVAPLSSTATQLENWTLPVKSLPELLTGGNGENATRLSVNNNGQVLLTDSGIPIDTNTGTVTVAGAVDAANMASNQTGGSVYLLGNKVALVEQAKVDVSGDIGGGQALIGGDYQGQGQVPTATETFIGSNAIIQGDAISNGNGGRVIIWADNATRFYGNITARGGINSGNGGFVEVSGEQNLAFAGMVDIGATVGKNGQLLLDPTSVVIGTDGTNDNQLNDRQILATDPGNTFFISATRIVDILNNGNVSIAATNDITINSLINASANTLDSSLTFTAPLINLNASINNRGNITFNGAVNNRYTINPPLPFNRFNSITTGGNITFNNSIDSTDTSGLILRAGGNVALLGTIGRTNSLSSLNIQQANNVDLRDFSNQRLDITASGNLNIQTPENIILEGNQFLRVRGDVQLIAPSITIQDITNSYLQTDRDLIMQSQNNILINNISLNVGQNINLQGQNITLQGNSNLQAQGDLILQAQGLLTLTDSQLYSLGNMQLLGQGNQGIQIQDSVANPVILMTGGNLNLQGDQVINIQALISPQSVFQTNGSFNLVSNGTITGNGRFVSGGDFSALNLAGELGNFIYNPISSNGIISSNGNVNFGNYTGVSLKVEARGSIRGGDITITGANTNLAGTDKDIAILSSLPALILQAGLTELRNNPTVTPNQPRITGGTTFTATAGSLSPGNIQVGTIDITASPGGRVILSGTGNIQTGNITTEALSAFSSPSGVVRNILELNGTVEISTVGNIETGKINTRGSSSYNSFVSLVSTAGSIQVQSIETGSGGLFVSAFDLFRVTGVVNEAPDYSTFGNSRRVINLPVSIILRPTDLSNRNNVPLRIQYGNGSTFIAQYPQITDGQSTPAFVQTGTSPFAVGPVVTGRLFPDIDSDIVGDTINQTYRLLNADEFPTNVSGTVGAIAYRGTDAGFYGSFQNRPFIPAAPINPQVDAPDTPVSQPINPVLPVNSPSSPDLIANNPNSSLANTDQLPKNPDLQAQTNDSNSLNRATNPGRILNVDLFQISDKCQATGMKINEDGTIELTGSCLPKDDEQPKNEMLNPP